MNLQDNPIVKQFIAEWQEREALIEQMQKRITALETRVEALQADHIPAPSV